MSRNECASADWLQVGYKDGGEGRPRTRIEDHARACAQAGIDRARYFASYDQGLRLYCTPENGLRAGRAGQSYFNVCPPNLAPGFLGPYRYGCEIYLVRSRIDTLESRRRERERDRLEYQERSVRW